MLSLPLTALASLSAAGLVGGVLAVTTAESTPRARPVVIAAPTAAAVRSLPATRHGPAPSGAPVAAAPTVPARSWRWPLLVRPRVVRGFDPPVQRWLPGHRGVDLAAVPGDTVVAAGAGVVTFAGPVAGRGVVTVTHGELRTTYEPVTALARVGDVVAAGEPIGTLAAGAGHCGGYPTCLHWGLLRGSIYLDPLGLLGLGHPILLPIPDG